MDMLDKWIEDNTVLGKTVNKDPDSLVSQFLAKTKLVKEIKADVQSKITDGIALFFSSMGMEAKALEIQNKVNNPTMPNYDDYLGVTCPTCGIEQMMLRHVANKYGYCLCVKGCGKFDVFPF